MYYTSTTSMLAVDGVPGVVLQHEESMVVLVSSFAGGV
jgi:hypothetical protein